MFKGFTMAVDAHESPVQAGEEGPVAKGPSLAAFLASLAGDGGLVGITCTDRRDGGGAQAMAVMSTLAHAARSGIPYFHTPFQRVMHSDGKPDWPGRWERFFNLGEGEAPVPEGVPVMLQAEYLEAGRPAGVIVGVPHCHPVVQKDQTADAYTPELRESFRRKYLSGTPKPPRSHGYVALHVRRGNVSATKWSDRYTPDERVAASVTSFRAHTGLDAPVALFSQGSRAEFAFLEACGVTEFHLDEDVFDTVHRMVQAEGLIMGRSTFSYIAALLGEGPVLTEDWYHKPMSDWLVEQWDGRVLPWGRSLRAALRCRALDRRLAGDPAAVIAELEAQPGMLRESAESRLLLARAKLATDPEGARKLLLGLTVDGCPQSEAARQILRDDFAIGPDGKPAG